MKGQKILYWYMFHMISRQGEISIKSYSQGLLKKDSISISVLDHVLELAFKDNGIQHHIVSVSYLGKMSSNEFYHGGSAIPPKNYDT